MKDKETKSKVVLGLGSNLGDREDYLIEALNEIRNLVNTNIENYSSIYETKPISDVVQGKYLNMVVVISTKFDALELLLQLQKIEYNLGRERSVRWGARTIDIDILLYKNKTINLPNLIIPHPRMFERSFVLIPLGEVLGRKVMGINLLETNEKIYVKDDVVKYRDKNEINFEVTNG